MKSRIIICGMALALASVSHAAYTPIALQSSSYNADVIVESNATPVLKCVTTASLDNGTANTASTWYEIGYDAANPGFGLPAAGTVVTARDNANYSFRMPPTYVGNNGILIDTVISNGTFTLTAPAAYNLLSFAGSGGNGGDVIGVRVNHADGTFETGSFGCPDWFGGNGVIMAAQGRMGDNVAHTLQSNGDNPRIYFRDVVLTNTTSPVTNIVLSYVSGSAGSHNDVLAVSGATTPGGAVAPIAVTGYTYDFVVEASAARRDRLVSQTVIDGTNVWATTQTYDNDTDTGFTYYEKGYNFNLINNLPFIYGDPTVDAICQSSGIPNHGSTFTNAAGDHIYTMPPSYTANDAVWMNPVMTNATITFATPTTAAALSFLSAAGNGPVTPIVVVHHQNGISETNIITIQDWFSAATPMWIPNGRVAADSGQFSQVTVTKTGANRLFASDLPLTEIVSPVTSIDLVYTNTGGRAGIFAVSALTGVVPPIIVQNPASTNAIAGSTIQFGVQVTGSTPINFSWQKGTNGVFALLSNGGNVSGATTTNLTITAANYFSDGVDYRFIASNAGGSVTSSVATATLFSTNTDVTQPGDPITALNVNLFGDGAPSHAIDNDLGQKFGANLSGGPAALVISPVAGRTIVSALRIYTGNDAAERDPASYKLEGSLNGGSTYTLIASNTITLPDGRNTTGGAPDPLVAFVKEVSFANTNGYTTYKLSFPTLKGGSGQGSIQFEEMELLGVIDSSKPFFSTQPADAKAYGAPTGLGANSATFTANATFTPTPTISWRKGTNGVFVSLTDAGNISGSQTTTLTVNPTTFADSADYIAVANSTAGFVTSSIAHLFIYSTNVTVAVPSDSIFGFGDYTGDRYAGSTNANLLIDTSFLEWINGGDGLNAGAGFPPFGENATNHVAVVLTPSVGNTVLSGLRFYPGQAGAESDPASFVLQGSNNGGTSYTTIASGSLSLPIARNAVATAVNPIDGWAQEILFANTLGYTSYRLELPTVRDLNTASSMHLGEVEFLGVAAAPVPVISTTTLTGGTLTITGSGGTPGGSFSVQTNANLTLPAGWATQSIGTYDGSGNFSIGLPVIPGNPQLFYRIAP